MSLPLPRSPPTSQDGVVRAGQRAARAAWRGRCALRCGPGGAPHAGIHRLGLRASPEWPHARVRTLPAPPPRKAGARRPAARRLTSPPLAATQQPQRPHSGDRPPAHGRAACSLALLLLVDARASLVTRSGPSVQVGGPAVQEGPAARADRLPHPGPRHAYQQPQRLSRSACAVGLRGWLPAPGRWISSLCPPRGR